MATVIAADNLPAVLTQIADRQDELDARIDALTSQMADQAIHADEQDEQLRVQAAALRMTATQLSTNIREIARSARNGNGNGGSNGNGNGNGDGNGNDRASNPGQSNNPSRNPGRSGRIAGARLGGEANVGPASASAEIGGGLGLPPEEPKAPERQRAHRWI